MTEVKTPEAMVGEAVQWWLEKEAGNSTFNQNKVLDDLELGRQTLKDKRDPKISGHINRMDLWLSEYGNPDLSPAQSELLTAKTAYGALMFLSGTYRRQRYLQAADQKDYFRRKLEWSHPGGIAVSDFFSDILSELKQTDVSSEDVKGQGYASLATTENAFRVLYWEPLLILVETVQNRLTL